MVLIAQEHMTGTPSEVYWLLGTATIVAGIVVLCVGMQAMLRRHGGSIYEGGGDLGRGAVSWAIFAIGGAWLGYELWSERPVDVDGIVTEPNG